MDGKSWSADIDERYHHPGCSWLRERRADMVDSYRAKAAALETEARELRRAADDMTDGRA